MHDIAKFDSFIKEFLEADLPWSRIMIHLKQTRPNARVLQSFDNSIMHLVLFNPIDHDYCLYLKLTLAESGGQNSQHLFEIFAVNRGGARNSIEFDHINDVMNSILYYLWNGEEC
jgi:hypothetical protein